MVKNRNTRGVGEHSHARGVLGLSPSENLHSSAKYKLAQVYPFAMQFYGVLCSAFLEVLSVQSVQYYAVLSLQYYAVYVLARIQLQTLISEHALAGMCTDMHDVQCFQLEN